MWVSIDILDAPAVEAAMGLLRSIDSAAFEWSGINVNGFQPEKNF